MRPSMATNPAASSRACSTTLSSPDVLPEDADEPADEAPAELPAKLPAMAGAMENAARAQSRSSRVIGRGPERGRAHEWYRPEAVRAPDVRSEEHTSELQSLMRISYAVFCLKKKKTNQ